MPVSLNNCIGQHALPLILRLIIILLNAQSCSASSEQVLKHQSASCGHTVKALPHVSKMTGETFPYIDSYRFKSHII